MGAAQIPQRGALGIPGKATGTYFEDLVPISCAWNESRSRNEVCDNRLDLLEA